MLFRSIVVSINLYSASRYGIGAGVYSVSKSMYSGSIPYASSIYYPEGTVGSISDKATYSSGTLMVTNLDGYYSMVGNFQTADGDSLLIQFSGSLYEYGYSYTQAKKFEVEEP